MPDTAKTGYTAEQFTELRRRVIRGDNALRCCSNQGKRVALDALRIANEALRAISEASAHRRHTFALVPAPGALAGVTTGEITWSGVWLTSAAATATIGAVVLATGLDLAGIATQTGALEAAEFIARAIGTLSSTRSEACYSCLKRACLPQTNPRKYERTKIRRRVG